MGWMQFFMFHAETDPKLPFFGEANGYEISLFSRRSRSQGENKGDSFDLLVYRRALTIAASPPHIALRVKLSRV